MGDAATAEALQEASDGFFLAAEYGRSDVIKALADHGRGQIDLAAIVDPATGRSPLHVAVANGKTDALRVLLAAGFPPDVESREDAGDSMKHGASRRRKRSAYALAQELQAADLMMVFHQFLIQQVAANNAVGVEQMLAAGIDVAVTDGASSSSLLHWAVSCQAVDVLADLLKRSDVQEQALVNRRNCDGATPLHLAAHSNQAQCVRLLLSAGADLAIRGEKAFSAGKTAAELTTSPEIVELLRRGSSTGNTGSAGDNEASVNGDGNRSNDMTKASDCDPTSVKVNGHTSAANRDTTDGDQAKEGTPREKHDETTCEHPAQVGKLLLQLEEKDLLINQLKKTIEDLVVEAQEIQKLGEERVMLEYVRKLREEKTVVERQLDDANDYIGVQQEQIADLKTQIRRMCDEQQAPPVANGHAEGATKAAQPPNSAARSNGHVVAPSSGQDHETQEEDDTQTTTDPSAQSLKLDAWTPRSQREPSVDASGGEPWRAVWSGLWQGKESAAVAHEEDGEVIMTV